MKQNRVRIACLSVLAIVFLGGAAWAEKPWYAAQFEKLGFYVYEAPIKQKDFTLTSLDGKLSRRSELAGKIVLLNFWATWCPPCKEEIPSIQKLADSMQGKAFTVMAVSVGEKKTTVAEFAKQWKMRYPVYIDPQNILGKTYASRGIPTTYVLDKQGGFIAAIIGSFKFDSAEVIALFTELADR